jgi:hypothetical protein
MPSSEQLKNASKEAGGVVAGAIGSGIVAWVSGWQKSLARYASCI